MEFLLMDKIGEIMFKIKRKIAKILIKIAILFDNRIIFDQYQKKPLIELMLHILQIGRIDVDNDNFDKKRIERGEFPGINESKKGVSVLPLSSIVSIYNLIIEKTKNSWKIK